MKTPEQSRLLLIASCPDRTGIVARVATFLAERAVVFTKRPARIVHDGRIDLPSERTAALRGEPAFARAASELLTALEKGAT